MNAIEWPCYKFAQQYELKMSFFFPKAARIIAKLAAWGRDLMEGSDLNYYFNWIKSQLSSQVRQSAFGCESVLYYEYLSKVTLSFYSAFLNCKVSIMSVFMYIKSDNDINPRVDTVPDCDSSRKVNRTLYFPRWFI